MQSIAILRLRFIGVMIATGLMIWAFVVLAMFSWGIIVEGNFGRAETSPTTPFLLLLTLPTILLMPLMGYVAQSHFRRVLMLAFTTISFLVVMVLYLNPVGQPWLSFAGLLSIFTVQYLMLAHVLLTEIKLELKFPQLAIVSAMLTLLVLFAFIGGVVFSFQWSNNMPPADALKLLLAAILVSGTLIPISVPPTQTTSSNFVQTLREGTSILWREPYTRLPLMMVTLVAFMVTLVSVWIVRARLGDVNPLEANVLVWERTMRFIWGLLIGWVISALHPNTFRHGFFLPHAALIAVFSASWLLVGESRETPMLLLGIAFGSVLSPLWNWVSNWTKPGWHGIAAMWFFGGIAFGIACAAAVGLAGQKVDDIASISLYLLLGSTIIMAIAGWTTALARPMVEGSLEFLLLPMYHVHRHGPGVDKLPIRREPVIFLVNHAAWFDPLWFSKSLPAPCTPLMTSVFYDLPVIHFFMKRMMGTIRVPDAGYRKEAPELKEAVAELRRNNALLIFPEGYLRRKDDNPIRRFGRGVWHILKECPDVPVIACWIEGGWGSFFSFKNGPPTKGKPFDFFRRIDIGFREPVLVPPEILADQLKTRLFLMTEVSLARTTIGLPAVDLTNALEISFDGTEE